jgi:protein TIF31
MMACGCCRNRYMAFVKNAVKQFQTLRLQRLKEKEEKKEEGGEEGKETEVEEAKKLMDTLTSDDNTKEIVKSAAAAVGSVSETEFEVKFNPDVFQPHVRLADEEVSDVVDRRDS